MPVAGTLDVDIMRPVSKSTSATLDAMRAISAQMVVVGHGALMSGLGAWMRPPNFPYIQNIGVVIFFYMSGFVIAMSIASRLARNDGYDFVEFVFDRAIRFAVTMIPCLAVIAIFDAFTIRTGVFARIEQNFDVTVWFGNLLMLQNHPWIGVPPFFTGRPLWSIAAEWWTYMFFGYLILMPHTSPKRLLLTLPLLVLAVPVVEIFFLKGRGLTFVWLLGALSYYMLVRLPEVKGVVRWSILATLFVSLIPYMLEQIHTMGNSYSIFAGITISLILFCVLILSSNVSLQSKGIYAHMFEYVAKYSFTLYCVHYTIYSFLRSYAEMNGMPMFVTGFIVSNIVSIAIAHFTEMRYPQYRAWIKAFWSRRNSTVAA